MSDRTRGDAVVEVMIRPARTLAELFLDQSGFGLEEDVDGLMGALGIPGRSQVVIGPAADLRRGQPMSVTVDGRRCRYPTDTVRGAYEAVLDEFLPDEPDAELEVRLRACEQAPAVLRLVAVEAVRMRPSVLLGAAQFERYYDTLREADPDVGGWPAARLWPVLRAVLELRISLADVAAVLTALRDVESPVAARESVAAALRPDRVDIRLPPGVLRELMDAVPADRPDVLTTLRDGLFNELGVWLPPFRFVPDGSLSTRAISLTVNSLPTMPMHALAPEKVLVNDTADRLRLIDVTATSTRNLMDGLPAAVADADSLATLDEFGVTRWLPLEHLVHVIAATVRRHAWCLLDERVVEAQCDQLGQAFPALVDVARELIPIPTLAAVLRSLLAEGVSIRNLRRILERMIDSTDPFLAPPLEARGESADHPRYVGDAHLAALVAYTRAGLAWQLCEQFGSGTGTVVAYLAGDDLERELALGSLEGDAADRILRGIHTVVGVPQGVPPAILTVAGSRDKLRALIEAELPMPVLTYGDLPSTALISPVARISLDS